MTVHKPHLAHRPLVDALDALSENLGRHGCVYCDARLQEAQEAARGLFEQLSAPCRCDKCRDCVAAEGYERLQEQLEIERQERADFEASQARLLEQFETLRKVAEGLFQMIDRETWRATGGDDQQGHYEGDYRAAQIEEYLVGLRASNPASEPDS